MVKVLGVLRDHLRGIGGLLVSAAIFVQARTSVEVA